jgi:hypothetical protein
MVTRTPEMPGFIKPQLATLKAKAPSGDQWLHEIKFRRLPDTGPPEQGEAEGLHPQRARLDETILSLPVP